MKFSVCIPNYNSSKWINRLLDSIENQTYKDYEVIIVDDKSTDDSVDKIRRRGYPPIINKRKRYNGGSRNEAVDHAKGDYLLFIDCDDYFYSDKAFERIAKLTESNPDCVRLSYHYLVSKGEGNVTLAENTPEKLVKSIFVAPWTKCIKRELFVPFPENTLIEDVTQHIEQVDRIETIEVCKTPIVVWNCRNEESVSRDKFSKRKNSYFRILADVLDINVTKPYCLEQKQARLDQYIQVTKEKLNDL